MREMLYTNRWKPFLFLLVLIFAIPLFLNSSYTLTVLILIGLYSMIALGLSLLIGYAGQISLGHAAFYGIGAYSSGILTATYGFSPWIAMLIGLVITTLIAYLVGIPTLKLTGHYLALATLGFNIIVYILITGMYDFTGGASGLLGIPKLSLFGFTFNSEISYYFLVWVIVLLIALLSLNIVQSHAGRVLRGIHDSEMATMTQGVNVSKFKLHIFVLSAVFASLAGSLYAHFINFIAPPTFYVTASILFLVMVVVGGAQPIWGAILGAFVITLLGEAIRSVLPLIIDAGGEVEIVVYGLVIILVLMFIPKGLISIPLYLRDKLNRTSSFSKMQVKGDQVQNGE
jgi:branched-chain amino acid transport system permease protein